MSFHHLRKQTTSRPLRTPGSRLSDLRAPSCSKTHATQLIPASKRCETSRHDRRNDKVFHLSIRRLRKQHSGYWARRECRCVPKVLAIRSLVFSRFGHRRSTCTRRPSRCRCDASTVCARNSTCQRKECLG